MNIIEIQEPYQYWVAAIYNNAQSGAKYLDRLPTAIRQQAQVQEKAIDFSVFVIEQIFVAFAE